MTDFNKILKNILSLAAGEFLVRIFNLLSYIYLARILLPEGFGQINFAAALIPFFLLAVNYGFDSTAIRSVSIEPKKLPTYLINITFTKIVLAFFSYLILAIIVSRLNISIIEKEIILIYGLSIFANALMMSWAYRALEETLPLIVVQLISGVINLIALITFIHSVNHLLETIWILVISGFINSFLQIIFFYKYITPLNLIVDLQLIKNLFKESTPIALSLIMICVYYNLNQVMLGLWSSAQEVAFYSAGYKIFLAGILPASIILNAFFPQLSKTKDDASSRSELMNKYSALMFVGGMFISMIGILFSEQIILIAFGEQYKKSILLLTILMVNSIFVFINITYGNPLLAWRMDRKYFKAIFSGAFFNIILGLLFIPSYAAIGAVIATLLSETIVLLCVAYYHYSFTKELHLKKLFNTAVSTTFSFLVCKLILIFTQNWLFALAFILVMHPFLIFKSGLISFNHYKKLILHEI